MSDDSVTTPEEMEFITKVDTVLDSVEALASYAGKAKDKLEDFQVPESMIEEKVKDAIKQIENLEAQLSMTVFKDTEADVKEVIAELEISQGKLQEMLEEQESKGQGKPKVGQSGPKS